MKNYEVEKRNRRIEIASMIVSAIGFAATVFSFLYEVIDFALLSRWSKFYNEGKKLVNLRSALFDEFTDQYSIFFILFAVCAAVTISLMLLSALNTDKQRNAKAGLIISGTLFVIMSIIINGDSIAGEGLEVFVIAPLWLISSVVEIVLFLVCFFNKKKAVKLIGLSLFTAAAIFMCCAYNEFFGGEEYLCAIASFVSAFVFTVLNVLAVDEEQPRELTGKEKAARVLATVLCAVCLTVLSTALLITCENVEWQRYYSEAVEKQETTTARAVKTIKRIPDNAFDTGGETISYRGTLDEYRYYLYSFKPALSNEYSIVTADNIETLRQDILDYETQGGQGHFSNKVSEGDYFITEYYDQDGNRIDYSRKTNVKIYFYDSETNTLDYVYYVFQL